MRHADFKMLDFWTSPLKVVDSLRRAREDQLLLAATCYYLRFIEVAGMTRA